jgi:hypothetical protein
MGTERLVMLGKMVCFERGAGVLIWTISEVSLSFDGTASMVRVD